MEEEEVFGCPSLSQLTLTLVRQWTAPICYMTNLILEQTSNRRTLVDVKTYGIYCYSLPQMKHSQNLCKSFTSLSHSLMRVSIWRISSAHFCRCIWGCPQHAPTRHMIAFVSFWLARYVIEFCVDVVIDL